MKKGGPNPVSNTALAAILEKAKELDVPKDILERNIKRASDKGQEAYIEKVYELCNFFFFFHFYSIMELHNLEIILSWWFFLNLRYTVMVELV